MIKMKIKLDYNKRASETVERLKKVGIEKFGIEWTPLLTEAEAVLSYGLSDFNLPKDAQAVYFEDIVANTIITKENYDIIEDYRLVVMKNPTRIMLWKDAKNISGTKYLYVENKVEWRVNYSFGKVNAVINKNLKGELFGKADITKWTPEESSTAREVLINLTKEIANKLKEDGYNLESFGIDFIKNNMTDEYLFLELNQANSLNETGCELFLKGFIEKINKAKRFKHIDEFYDLLDDEELEHLFSRMRGD